MTPSQMEQEIRILNAQVGAIEKILPTLATKEDLRAEVAKLATKEDLKLTTSALEHEIHAGIQRAIDHADHLHEITQEQFRLLRASTAEGFGKVHGDVQKVREDLTGEVQKVREDLAGEVHKVQEDLTREFRKVRVGLTREIRSVSRQIAKLARARRA